MKEDDDGALLDDDDTFSFADEYWLRSDAHPSGTSLTSLAEHGSK